MHTKEELQEIQRKYELTTSKEWKEIRKRLLDIIVIRGGSSLEYLQGMLYLIKLVDSWEQEFTYAKEKESQKE